MPNSAKITVVFSCSAFDVLVDVLLRMLFATQQRVHCCQPVHKTIAMCRLVGHHVVIRDLMQDWGVDTGSASQQHCNKAGLCWGRKSASYFFCKEPSKFFIL